MSRVVSAVVLLALGVTSTARAQDGEEPTGPSFEEEAPSGEVPWYQRGAEGAPAPSPEPPEPAEAPAPEDPPEPDPPAEEHSGGFYFGSYGRIVAASDLDGRSGRQNLVTTWGPRVDEHDTYAEIELRREDRFAGMHTQVVATIAYFGPLFHYDGELSERIAFRNLYARVGNLLTPGLNVWAGSRMWRGDDVYLFNFWPLDNLNLVGGGLSYDIDDVAQIRIAGGLHQPDDPFQRQELLAPARVGFTPETVVFLDRPRAVSGARLTWWTHGRRAREGMKAILYGEGHFLPGGTRRDEAGFDERLPEDGGWVVGGQFGGYLADQNTFANLFVRYARGLGAYDPLGVPFREGSVIQTGRAEELRIALSANWEHDIFGLMVGAYYRYFRDADPNVFGRGTLTEGSVNVRPMVWLDRYVGVSADLSYSGMAASAIDERTGNPAGGNVFKLGIMPFVTPFGRGTYTRPHLRLIYALTVRDEGARALYPVLDPRSVNDVEHFFGIGVEWWFSSTSYGF
ncbi:MAG: carbohydrate porin [Sandaracinaceae bacterium]|nr:carbohydrate porin [Sandaracinaceae bacterium]